MKVSAYLSVGNWSESIDVEYQSESKTDCEQADKHVSLILGAKKDEISPEKITVSFDETYVREQKTD